MTYDAMIVMHQMVIVMVDTPADGAMIAMPQSQTTKRHFLHLTSERCTLHSVRQKTFLKAVLTHFRQLLACEITADICKKESKAVFGELNQARRKGQSDIFFGQN